VARCAKILGWCGDRNAVSFGSCWTRFWDHVVREIQSALADRWPDSDRNAVSSADRGGQRVATEIGGQMVIEILSGLADRGDQMS
jgi:hypothetical protein